MTPRLRLAARIEEVTGGEVTVADFAAPHFGQEVGVS